MTGNTVHQAVLLDEVIEALDVRPDGLYVDGTCGGGGHSEAILGRLGPGGRLVSLDLDRAALTRVRARGNGRWDRRWQLIQASFADLGRILAGAEGRVDGIVLDLGISSDQLEDAARGFAYQYSGPLDMRFSGTGGVDATAFVNTAPPEELTRVFRNLGEERRADAIARAIVRERRNAPIETTGQLRRIVEENVRPPYRTKSLSRVFQAIRMHVNREIEALEIALPAALRLLSPGGRLAVIAFESISDRIVKRFMRRCAQSCVCPPGIPECRCNHTATLELLTRRPITPGADEIQRNPRARSARLRVAKRLDDEAESKGP